MGRLGQESRRTGADVCWGGLARSPSINAARLTCWRHGVEMIGLRQLLALAQFKPALAMNPDISRPLRRQPAALVRQLRYSLHNENALDLVFFVNGIPVAHGRTEKRFHPSVDDLRGSIPLRREPRPKGRAA